MDRIINNLKPSQSAKMPAYFKPGQRISYSGFVGTIIRHYADGMWEVRLPGGVTCVSGSEIIPL